MKKTLILYFNTSNKKTHHVILDYPKDNLTKAEIEPVAQKIIDSQIFNNEKTVLTTFKKASYITKEENDLQ
ncbi:DUF2922 domain-containing protein [Gemella cuniculi]|uniref:DUF2922 domain-containing protein n=1 Tax=Gemella cuniculi TaxID=150240 RepID=UPI00040276CE|nr:DUF2922 domain-containing protein [Gemella cuniculi]